MASTKNILIYGAGGGYIGRQILDALLEDGMHKVSVLSRKSSKASFPAAVRDLRFDDDMPYDQVVGFLQGIEVVISTVGYGTGALETQYKFIDAAIQAGVKRFFPSEYGCDNDPKNAELSPVFKKKADVAEYLQKKAEEHPDFSWTAVATSSWLEMWLDYKIFAVDTVAHTVSYWDDGIYRPSHTTIPYAARATIRCLEYPEETRNQRVFTEAFAASQKEIVAELEKQQGIRYKELPPTVGALAVAEAHARLEQLDTDHGAAISTIMAGVMMKEYGNDFRAAGKKPLIEDFADMPQVTLEDGVKLFLAQQKEKEK